MKYILLTIVGILSLSAQARSGDSAIEKMNSRYFKLICVPADRQEAPFRCVTTETEIKTRPDQSYGRFEFISNSGKKIVTRALVTQSSPGLSEISLTARGLHGKIDIENSERINGVRVAPATFNVFDARVDFSGNLLCQSSLVAFDWIKQACDVK